MSARRGGLHLFVLVAALAAARPAAGQTRDAFVPAPGVLRLGIEGLYTNYDTRFSADGSARPLAAPLLRPLTGAEFAPLAPLAPALQQFFAATAASAGGAAVAVIPDSVTLGTPDIRIARSTARAPIQLSAGVLPRLEVGVSLPLVRRERVVQRFGIGGGTVGINPSPQGNAALLRRVGAQWEALGASVLLPTDSSALGRELQRRVRALTGSSLSLPGRAVNAADLQALLSQRFGFGPVEYRLERWRLGDAEVFGKALLLSSFGRGAYPVDSAGTDFRLSVVAGARIPTGVDSTTNDLTPVDADVGRTAIGAGLVGDLFVGPRFWTTASVRYTQVRPMEVSVRVVSPEAPLSSTAPPQRVTLDPGDELELRLAPRFRLVPSIALGAEYQLSTISGARYTAGDVAADVLDTAPGVLHQLGLTAHYTTLPAVTRGETQLPAEITLIYFTALAGPQGFPAARSALISVSVYPRLW